MTETVNDTGAPVPFKLFDTDNLSGIPAGWIELVRAAEAGQTYEQIAAFNTLPVGTVKSRIHRTRSRVQAQRLIAANASEGGAA